MADSSDPLGDALDFEVVAASLRLGREDVAAFIAKLSTRLSRALPGKVQIDRAGAIRRKVVGIRVQANPGEYRLQVDDGDIRCSISSVVRNVVIKTDEVDLDSWIAALSKALVELAEHSQVTRAGLDRLLY